MTKEEYADYAITFLLLRGGPMPERRNFWDKKGTPLWGVRHYCKNFGRTANGRDGRSGTTSGRVLAAAKRRCGTAGNTV